MEVMQYTEEAEVEVLGEWLQHRRSQPHTTSGGGGGTDMKSTAIDDSFNGTKGKHDQNLVYFDKNRVAGLDANFQNLAIQEVLINQGLENLKDEISPDISHILPTQKSCKEEKKPSIPLAKGKKSKHVKFELIEESDEDEDVIELEFEREIVKHDTHTMHCPNCEASITKVVLRRKRVKKDPSHTPSQQNEPVGLLGCLSCFSVFIPSENCFNWFRIFGNGGHKDNKRSTLTTDKGDMVIEQGDCFSLFRIFKNKSENKNTERPKQESPNSASVVPGQSQTIGHDIVDSSVTSKSHEGGKYIGSKEPPEWTIEVPKNPDEIRPDSTKPARQGTTIQKGTYDVENVPNVERPENVTETQGSKSLEILKSIVYGGLTESIASLSVVSSAAAANATTLNILAIALANLVGGLFIFGHNLRDLKNDCSEGASSNKYQEELGRRENFLLHATFAVLSFLLIGLSPPLIYGFTFRNTDDRDFKLLAVGAASFLCIVLLAIGKAYIQKPPKSYMYIQTIMYYVTIAVTVSGVSFAVGDSVQKLMENLGWFEATSAFTLSIPELKSTNPVSWASY